MKRVEEAVLIIGLLAISAAMLVLVGVETANCVKRFQVSISIQKDVEGILKSGSDSGKPWIPDASQRYLADLTAIQKESQDSGTTSFLYTLTMFAVVAVSGRFYWRAVAKFNTAQDLVDEHRKSIANSSQTQTAALSLAVAEGLALQIGRRGAVALASIAPVMRDCIKDVDNSLQNVRRNRGAISPVLYDGLRNGIKCIGTCLSSTIRAGGATEVQDILDMVNILYDQMGSEEFTESCRRELGNATKVED
jgi:hypothetical protein